MRMVRSLWTKPQRWRHEGAEELWAWSLLRLVRFYGAVDVYTDELGEFWLRALGLPCADKITFHRLLDELKHVDPHVWSLGKLYTAMHQTEPFIATDGDVVIGRAFPERMHRATVCTERLYSRVPDQWMAQAVAPDRWRRHFEAGNGLSFNCGTFGGCDIPAIQHIAKVGYSFAITNASLLKTVRNDLAAIACEEWSIAREYDPLEVTTLSCMGEHGDELLARYKAYWHQPGATKIDPKVRAKVNERLESECPGQLARCQEVARKIGGRYSQF